MGANKIKLILHDGDGAFIELRALAGGKLEILVDDGPTLAGLTLTFAGGIAAAEWIIANLGRQG